PQVLIRDQVCCCLRGSEGSAASLAYPTCFQLTLAGSDAPSSPSNFTQVPDEREIGFQISHTIVGRFRNGSGRGQWHQEHNIAGGELVICKKWNYHQQRLNFSTDPIHILLFLAQNSSRI